jgi:hypothetical protein
LLFVLVNTKHCCLFVCHDRYPLMKIDLQLVILTGSGF